MAIWTGIRLEVEVPQGVLGETFFILLETGDDLLLESGDIFLLETAP